MIDCIRNDYINQKNRFEQMKSQEIELQKQKAENEVVTPKFAEIENQKQLSLQIAQDAYQRAVASANDVCDNAKKAFREATYKKIEEVVSAEFATALFDLEKKLS